MKRIVIRFRDRTGAYRLLAELMRLSSPLRWLVRVRREGRDTLIDVPVSSWNSDVKELVIGFGGRETEREAKE